MLCKLQSDLLENPGTKLGDGSDIVWFIPWSSQECMQCLGIDCQSTPRCFWQQDWYLSQSAHPQHKPLSLPGGFFRSLQNPWTQSWSSWFSLLFLFLDFPSFLFCHLMSCTLFEYFLQCSCILLQQEKSCLWLAIVCQMPGSHHCIASHQWDGAMWINSKHGCSTLSARCQTPCIWSHHNR